MGVPVQVMIDGPYGGCSVDLGEYETALLVAGGSGITFALGVLDDIVGRVVRKGQASSWIARRSAGVCGSRVAQRCASAPGSSAASAPLDRVYRGGSRLTMHFPSLADGQAMSAIVDCTAPGFDSCEYGYAGLFNKGELAGCTLIRPEFVYACKCALFSILFVLHHYRLGELGGTRPS